MTLSMSPRLQLSFVLLTIMLIAGSLSAVAGYFFGRESLRGVTQPVVNPILGDVNSNAEALGQRQTLLKEGDIIAQVEKITKVKPKPATSPTPDASPSPEVSDDPSAAPGFPRTVTDQGVKLTINTVTRASGNLVLDVTLQNESPHNLQFSYTFLDVISDDGTSLIAITQGLPTELPADSDPFSGTIQIPLVSLDEVKTLSLSLADFPNQDVKLSLKDIPLQP